MKRFWIVFFLLGLAGCRSEDPGQVQDLGAITVRAPGAWRIETPSSGMRRAQYALPGQGGAGDASLVVFYFGPGQGGSVQANLERWFGQFEQPDGGPTRDVAMVSEKEVAGMKVTIADVSGTYAPSSMGPMMPAGEPEPDYRMLAAIVDTPAGFYYFKLTGPEKTVGHWEDEFGRFVGSIRKK